MKQKVTHTYFGKTALRKYLNPRVAVTPMVELPEQLDPFYADGVRIYAKMMNSVPLGNVKSLPAFAMLQSAERMGALEQVRELVENSSGNTAYSLAVLGRLFGVPQTRAIVSHEVSMGKLRALQLFGVNIEVNTEDICPDPLNPTSGVQKAKAYAKKDKTVLNLGQYDNIENPAAHEAVTGPQIWRQLRGRVDIFCAGLGTTGTLVGAGAYLKRKRHRMTVVGAVRLPNNPVPGVRTENLLAQVSFPWKEVVDCVEGVGTKDAYTQSMYLCRAGLLAGPSSGFAFAGLLAYLHSEKQSGQLARRSRAGLVRAVFVCPDGPFPYLNEYVDFVDSTELPKIINQDLLQTSNRPAGARVLPIAEVGECSVDELLSQAYNPTEGSFMLKKNVVIVDVRSLDEFREVHIPKARHILYQHILQSPKTYAKQFSRKRIFLICQSGRRSMLAAQALQRAGVRAVWSVRGGLAEWSAKGLGRVMNQTCRLKMAMSRSVVL